MAKKNITMIPAVKPIFASQNTIEGRKRRVAAYARVSTDSDEQFTSFEAQVDYYTKYIAEHLDWIFVKVYSEIIIPKWIQGKSRYRAGKQLNRHKTRAFEVDRQLQKPFLVCPHIAQRLAT